MALRFSVLCHLFSTLEAIARCDPPLLAADRQERQKHELETWFRAHRKAIDSLDAPEATALPSSFLPERRPDRVYGVQSEGLARILRRHLRLSTDKSNDLYAYRERGHGDLADCLQRVLEGGGPPALPPVTIDEVDRALASWASTCRFSGPGVKRKRDDNHSGQATFLALLPRLLPSEAKWLVRLLLKNLSPVQLDEQVVLRSMHFLLPDILRYQQDLQAAIKVLKGPFRKYPSNPDAQSAALLRRLVSASHRPRIGVKVSRSTFCKAWSINHCSKMTKKQRWMLERKYDGEFCEMHIDLTKQDWLKVYSKSGKDSTEDRGGIKDALRKSLSIGSANCKIKSQCILLGEMVVYSDTDKQILPFHKIRKYVSRSGTFIGTSHDSPPHSHEHLMMVYFDLLLLDDNNVMQKPTEERKALLRSICKSKTGRIMIAESHILDFGEDGASRRLMKHLAASVAARHEGLILKPCGRPYLSVGVEGDPSMMIKLKKDYINGLGDELDMAVIGASYDAQIAATKHLRPRSFTHFHLGCLLNAEAVDRWSAVPRYRYVGSVSVDGCVPPAILPRITALATVNAADDDRPEAVSELEVSGSAPRMEIILRNPLVFEVLGSSYDKPSNCDYWMLRHPRVKKLHEDRTWRDCVSFDDLQVAAIKATSAPSQGESQENIRWMDKIEQSCRRKNARLSAQTTPASKATISPLAVRKVGTPSPTKTAAVTHRSPQVIAASPRPPLAPRALPNSLPTPPTSSATQPAKRKSPSQGDLPRKRIRTSPASSPTRLRFTTSAAGRETHSAQGIVCVETQSTCRHPLGASASTYQPLPGGPKVQARSSSDNIVNTVSGRVIHHYTSNNQTRTNIADDPMIKAIVPKMQWRNVPASTEVVRGLCAFAVIASDGRITTCPLSNAHVYINRRPTICPQHAGNLNEVFRETADAWHLSVEAELHGASVYLNKEAWLAAAAAPTVATRDPDWPADDEDHDADRADSEDVVRRDRQPPQLRCVYHVAPQASQDAKQIFLSAAGALMDHWGNESRRVNVDFLDIDKCAEICMAQTDGTALSSNAPAPVQVDTAWQKLRLGRLSLVPKMAEAVLRWKWKGNA